MIRVLIADDQALARSGLRAILSCDDDLQVVGEAVDGEDAVAKAARLSPDVVLMDVRMPRLDGIGATRRLAGPGGPKIVVLTTFDDDAHLFDALRAGACGFLLKDATPDVIVDAVRLAHGGHGLLAPEVTRRVIDGYARDAATPAPAPDGFADLTAREVEIYALVARGRSNREIADVLVLSEATVKTHVGRLLSKLAMRDRVQLVVAAYEMGFVRPGTA